eukprot:354071-Chlamydomonas_euryale.AAC.4
MPSMRGANRIRWQVPSKGQLALLGLHIMQHSTMLNVPYACAACHGNACPLWQGCIKSLQLGASCHIWSHAFAHAINRHTLCQGCPYARWAQSERHPPCVPRAGTEARDGVDGCG